jgi:hypothetical protein
LQKRRFSSKTWIFRKNQIFATLPSFGLSKALAEFIAQVAFYGGRVDRVTQRYENIQNALCQSCPSCALIWPPEKSVWGFTFYHVQAGAIRIYDASQGLSNLGQQWTIGIDR